MRSQRVEGERRFLSLLDNLAFVLHTMTDKVIMTGDTIKKVHRQYSSSSTYGDGAASALKHIKIENTIIKKT